MRKIVFVALIFIASVMSASEFHVCTVANRMHPNLEKLIISCKENGIQLEILGMGQPYVGNTTKLRVMKEYCHRLPDDDLVLFVDAFDVLILADKQEIVSRFLALDVPMLMAMEMNCWPLKSSAPFHPPTSSPFKYINTGGYMGWVKAVRRWLDSFDGTLLSGKSDQGAAHKLFMEKPHLYALDHWCAIFLCLFQVPADAVLIDPVSRRVTCSYTNSSPCVLHANGRSFTIWNQVYSSFFNPGG